MYLERLVQINMATLAVLGALLLGMGQRSEGPPLLVAVAAVASMWLTDITGWFRLSRGAANVLMLLVGVVLLGRSFPVQNELQAFDFAWFLIYLQILFLFQVKDQRTYWLLVMFSLLQVIVATLFNQGVGFGILLAVYMLLGFSAMTLLLLYRRWQRSQPRDEDSGFVCLPGGDDRAGIGVDLLGRLGRMALQTMVLTAALFFVIPRFGQTTWRGAAANPQTLVGYSDTVALGTLGQVIEDPDKVMKVRFDDPANHKHRPITSEIYLQGAILMTYDSKRDEITGNCSGRWQAGLPSWNASTEVLDSVAPLPKSGLVYQDITIEALNHNELFYVAPFVPIKPTFYLSYNYAQQRLLRGDEDRSRQFRYRLGTTAIVDGVQKPLTPRHPLDATKRALELPISDDNAPTLPNLRRLAQGWIEQSGMPEKDRVGRARYLERQLGASGQFQYSLVGQDRDPKIDPIEDFVSKHRQGHCEYFATALTLMLRSQNIPARMVVGFKCDEWNSLGGYYQVRQLHAHTWVEAYLQPDQIPPELMHGGDYWHWKQRDRGGWLRLDPTPAGAGPSRQSNWLTPVNDAMDWLDGAWSSYVMNLDAERQREAIYGPIGRAAQAVWREFTDPGRWRAMLDATLATLHLDQLRGAAAWLAAAIAGILATLLSAAVGWLFWLLGRRLRARWTGNHGRMARRHTQIEFYRRFETLLARRGILRAPAETQREFAATAGTQLALLGNDPQLGRLPGVIADAFYRVRFGRQPLDSLQAQAVEHAIKELVEMIP